MATLSKIDRRLAVAGIVATVSALLVGVGMYFFVGLMNGFAGAWQWNAWFYSVPAAILTYGILGVALIRRTGLKNSAQVAVLGLITAAIVWYGINTVVGMVFSPFAGALSSNLVLSLIPLAVTMVVTLAAIAMGPMLANKFINK